MSLIHWLFRILGTLVARPTIPAPVQKKERAFRPVLRRLKGVSWLVAATLCLSPVNGRAGAQSGADQEAGNGTIVAAGFGYQIGETSTITVKVYDAASGEVLSDETYELNVNESDNARSNASRERIFAGGVGLGATDLSNFVLRVYDAKTGKFQWEGQLNLTPRDGSGAGQMISTLMPRRATVTRIATTETGRRQPSFLLRALDTVTGGLVWEDEFSTDGAGSARIQRIASRLTGSDGSSTEAARTFDFRIRMFDHSGRAVLWEDQVSQQEPEEDTHEAVDDQAHVLPAWPWQVQQDSASQSI